MSNFKSKDRKSLFEESMLVFVNILKLSSLSLARRTLITTSNHDHDEHNYDENYDHQHEVSLRATYKNENKDDHNDAPPLVHEAAPQRSKRLQKPEPAPECKMSYVMLPENDETGIINVDGQFSDYIKRFHEKTVNDLENAKATNYIKRFHEKNMKDLNNESMRRSHYVLPPPPHHHHHHHHVFN
ncbi:unnamed protein product [Amaranthus hypochondriacus]